jgi:hypothetical protein
MIYKLLFILSILLFTSGCSVTVVYVEKDVYVPGNNNTIEVTGSDLKDNQAQQSSAFDWFLEIPLLK